MKALLAGVALAVTLAGCGGSTGYDEPDTTDAPSPMPQSSPVGSLGVYADCDGSTRVYESSHGVYAIPNSPECDK